jgi:predicted DsbA family dithiol-disulfide isomerase
MPTIEVFADVWCPFTHVGLRRLVARRAEADRPDVPIQVRSWPLELVNGTPLDAGFVAEEIEALRRQVAPDLFAGFDVATFPGSTLAALDLAAAAYRSGTTAGEQVSLDLRTALFEEGRRIDDPTVLAEIARRSGIEVPGPLDRDRVLADLAEGRDRGVVGSPHFFLGDDGWFCPALDIRRVEGELRIEADAAALDRFTAACFGW